MNEYAMQGLGNFGDAFLKSYTTAQDRALRQQQLDAELVWKNEERAHTRTKREREAAFSRALEQTVRPAQVDSGSLVTDAAGSKAFTKDAEAAAMMSDMLRAHDQSPTVASATRVQDQTYTDPARAQAAETEYNSPVSLLSRMSMASMPFDPEKGISLQRSANEARKAQADLSKEQKAEIDERFNQQLFSVTSRPDWWVGAAELGTRANIAGLEGVNVTPELSADGKMVAFKATMPDGSAKVLGSFEANESGAQKWVQASARVGTKERLAFLSENMKYLREAESKTLDAQEKRGLDDHQTENKIRLAQVRAATRGGGSSNEGPRSSRLTLSQQRGNSEIDAARMTVENVPPDELKHRTTQYTERGYRNFDYDPALAKSAALASRRKVGEDPDFDQSFSGEKPQGQAARADAIPDRFKQDTAMSSNRLGKKTAKGFEVFDAKGRLIGFYR